MNSSMKEQRIQTPVMLARSYATAQHERPCVSQEACSQCKFLIDTYLEAWRYSNTAFVVHINNELMIAEMAGRKPDMMTVVEMNSRQSGRTRDIIKSALAYAIMEQRFVVVKVHLHRDIRYYMNEVEKLMPGFHGVEKRTETALRFPEGGWVEFVGKQGFDERMRSIRSRDMENFMVLEDTTYGRGL